MNIASWFRRGQKADKSQQKDPVPTPVFYVETPVSEQACEKEIEHYIRTTLSPEGIYTNVITKYKIDNFYEFIYQSKEFLETGNPLKMFLGNGPVLVNSIDGAVYLVPASQSSEDFIKQYLQEGENV